jgi:hypothetical protein
LRAKRARQYAHQQIQQVFDVARLHLGVMESEEGLRFRLPHLVVGAIQDKARDQQQLLPCRREPAFQLTLEQPVELRQNLQRFIRRQIHTRHPPAVVLHLFDERREGAQPPGRRRRDREQRPHQPRFVRPLIQERAKPAFHAPRHRRDRAQQ